MRRAYVWPAAVVALVAAAAVLRTGGEVPRAADPQATVRISAGVARARALMQLGETLVAESADELPDVRFVLLESPGSVRNLQNLQRGDADLGFVQADIAYLGYNGRLPDSAERFADVRGIAVMHSSKVHLLARRGVPIRSVADLKGRRVGVGPSDSGTALTSEMLMGAFHLRPDSVAGYSMTASQAVDQLIRGDLDATFAVTADPAEEVRRAAQAGARLVDISGAEVARFRGEHPFLRAGVIPGGVYPGHPEPVRTLAIDMLLLARAGLDETLVHRLTRAFFQALPRVAAQLEFIRTMDPTRAPATPVPLHPGAALYYRERELSR